MSADVLCFSPDGLTLSQYEHLSAAAKEYVSRSEIPVLDKDGNRLPRCCICRVLFAAYRPEEWEYGTVRGPSGLIYCEGCAADRNLGAT